jgi:hypothetical protein
MLLVMGESGTGKSTSMRNCNPDTTAVVNPVGKPLPFKGKFSMLNSETESRKICKFMKEQAAAGKKLLVVDDFQYILSVPYMNRIKESGWDKWNDFGANYFEIIEVCKELPDDVVVAYMTHTETLENGVTTIKLIGKLLREKITIEGLFTIVLRTGVNEGKYYFYTQNSGKDTVKSPMGMFPAYAIDNDLNYVADKIRNFYEVGEYKSDAEMNQEDAAVAADVAKPDTNGRRARGSKKAAETEKKTHDEVVAENKEKVNDYMKKCDDAIAEAAGNREEIPFDEAVAATENIPQPELETPPRRTRKERKGKQAEQTAEQSGDWQDNTDSVTVVLEKDAYFYRPSDGNYLMKHKGDSVDLVVDGKKVLEEITQEQFGEGVKALAQGKEVPNPLEGAMNPPEPGRRTRRSKEQPQSQETQADTESVQSEETEPEQTTRTRRTRRTR